MNRGLRPHRVEPKSFLRVCHGLWFIDSYDHYGQLAESKGPFRKLKAQRLLAEEM